MSANSIQAKRTATATIAASTVDLIVLTDPGEAVRVINVSGAAPIYFTVSVPGGPCPVPAINGVNTFVAAGSPGETVSIRHDGMYGSVIQLISASVGQYTVSVGSRQVNV